MIDAETVFLFILDHIINASDSRKILHVSLLDLSKRLQYSAFHPSGVGKSSTDLYGWGWRGVFTWVG